MAPTNENVDSTGMHTCPRRFVHFICQLFLAVIKGGLKPVQRLSFTTLRHLTGLYSLVEEPLGIRRGGQGSPGTASREPTERHNGPLEVIKIVVLDGIHCSSHPPQLSLRRWSTESIHMQDTKPDVISTHDVRQGLSISPLSLDPSSKESFKTSIGRRSLEALSYHPTSLAPHRALSTPSQAISSMLRDYPDQVSRRPDTNQLPLSPTDTGGDYFTRRQSDSGREQSRSPGPSLFSVNTAFTPFDFDVASLPRVGSSLLDPSVHHHTVQRKEEPDQFSNRPIPALNVTHLVPFSPDQTLRYDRRRFISDKAKEIKLPAGTRKFRDHEDPPDWVYIVHPEGKPFFFNKSKRALTDVNIFAPGLLRRVNSDIDIIHDHISLHRANLPRNYDVVLDLAYSGAGQDEQDIVTKYYCADHDNRVIFYLHEFDASELSAWYEIDGIYSVQHIGLELQAQYWFHLQLYPTTVALAEEMEAELRDTVLNFIGDTMTSFTSTSPYTLEELRGILDLTDPISKNFGKVAPGSLNLVARLRYIFLRQKFLDFNGLPCARLERSGSVYGNKTNGRTWLVKILSPILWSAPDVHLLTLQRMSLDGISLRLVQKQVVAKMTGEWQDYILFATVLLNANVAFLAIQTVDEGGGRSPGQTLSYISVAMSLGSIILGLLLVRQDRLSSVKIITGIRTAVKVLPGRKAEALAILYALPYAFLMWSLCFFTVAFACTVFGGTGTITPTLVGVVGVVVLSQVIHVIVATRRFEPPTIPVSEPPYLETGFGDDDEILDRVYGPAKEKKEVDMSKADKPWYTDPVSRLWDMWHKYLAGNQTETHEMVTIVIR